MFTTDTKAKIIEFIRQNGSATNAQLQAVLGISSTGISQHLRDLINSGQIIKAKKRYYLNQEWAPPQAGQANTIGSRAKTIGSPIKTIESSSKAIESEDKGGQLNSTVPISSIESPINTIESAAGSASAEVSKTIGSPIKTIESPIGGADEQSLGVAGPLQYWTAKLKVEPQLVENCHHEIYSWFFSFGRRVYNEPVGLGGKAIDSFIWILALGLSWIWKIFCIASSQVRLSRIFLFLFIVASIVVGVMVWRSHHVEQTGEYLNLGGKRLALEQELSQARAENADLRSQLAQAQEQIKALKADNEDLNHHVLKSMDESSKLGVENLSLKEQLDKAQKSSEGLGQKIKNKIFGMF